MSDIKLLRKQMRVVIKGELKDLLIQELSDQIEKRIMDKVNERLDKIDERQKAIQSYMIRQGGPKVDILK